MPLKVESAVVTKKHESSEVNTDSININGKVFSRDIIRSGYKGSGIVSGKIYFSLSTSNVDGFADAAVATFNDHAQNFSSVLPADVLKDYLIACREAVLSTEHSNAVMSSACFYACGKKATVAYNGEMKVYCLRSGDLSCCEPLEPSEENGKTKVFSDLLPDDIFILVGPGVSNSLTDKDINDICKVAEGSVKRIANLISKVALSVESDYSASVIAIKILETGRDAEENELGFSLDSSKSEEILDTIDAVKITDEVLPPAEVLDIETIDAKLDDDTVIADFDAADKIDLASLEEEEKIKNKVTDIMLEKLDNSNIIEPQELPVETDVENKDDFSNEEKPTEASKKAKLSKTVVFFGVALITAVILLVVVLIVKGIGNKENIPEDSSTQNVEEVSDNEELTIAVNSEETTTDAEDETEPTSSNLSTEEPTEAQSQREPVTQRPVQYIPQTTEPTTMEEPGTTGEETTKEEDTTAEDETTTEGASEDTTAEDETTTEGASEDTTAEGDTTTEGASEDTTAEGDTTTEGALEDTTATGDTTTEGALEDTTAETEAATESTSAEDTIPASEATSEQDIASTENNASTEQENTVSE